MLRICLVDIDILYYVEFNCVEINYKMFGDQLAAFAFLVFLRFLQRAEMIAEQEHKTRRSKL